MARSKTTRLVSHPTKKGTKKESQQKQHGSNEKKERGSAKEYTPDERMAMVCNLLCQGANASEIKKLLEERGIQISREEPYRLIARATAKQYLRFVAPLDYELMGRMREDYSFLRSVSIVRTRNSDDIAYQVAQLLLQMMKEYCQGKKQKINIAFGGGSLLRKSARWLSLILGEVEPDELPTGLTISALAAGADYRDLTSQPNAFFTYFSEEHQLPFKRGEVRFVGLPAPGLVTEAQFKDLQNKYAEITEAFDRKNDIDVYVFSGGGCWAEKHSALARLYDKASPETLSRLNKAGCLGDICWRPMSATGPLEIRTPIRATTLIELNEIPGIIKKGKRVLLSLAPCGECGRRKTDLLKSVINNKEKPFITDLVSNSHTVRPLLPGDFT